MRRGHRIPVNPEYSCCSLLLFLSLFALLLPGDCLFQGVQKELSLGKFGFKQSLARLIPKTQPTSKPSPAPSAAAMSTTSCGVAASVYNLAAFLMGGMVLFLPYGFKCAGLGLSMCIIAVVATMNGYMNWMLLQMSLAAKVDSYEDLCERVLGPRWRNLFLYSNSLLLLGCVCACVASVKSLLWIVVEDQGLGYLFGGSSTLLTTLVIIFFCIPVSCQESMSALSDFSMAGLYLNIAMALLMAKDAISAGLPGLGNGEPLFRSDFDVIKSFPIFSFAFFCTPALFPVYQEMDPSLKGRMPHVLAYTMAAAVCTYCMFGGFSYILFGQATQGNVIDNIPKGWMRSFLSLFNGLICTSCIPLVNMMILETMEQIFQPSDMKKKDGKPAKTPLATKILRSSLLNIAALAVVIAIPSIEHITEITGATFVTIVCYLIPCALFLKISGKGTRGDVLHRPMPNIGAIPGSISMHRFLACGILMLGTIMSGLSLSVIIPEVMGGGEH
jgi:amino acid permease